MFKLFQRFRYKLPLRIKNVWYNRSIYISKEEYPIVWDKDVKYIDPKIGLKVKMRKLKNGKFAYYKIVKIKKSKGSDWLHSTDNIDCDLQFSHISF